MKKYSYLSMYGTIGSSVEDENDQKVFNSWVGSDKALADIVKVLGLNAICEVGIGMRKEGMPTERWFPCKIISQLPPIMTRVAKVIDAEAVKCGLAEEWAAINKIKVASWDNTGAKVYVDLVMALTTTPIAFQERIRDIFKMSYAAGYIDAAEKECYENIEMYYADKDKLIRILMGYIIVCLPVLIDECLGLLNGLGAFINFTTVNIYVSSNNHLRTPRWDWAENSDIIGVSVVEHEGKKGYALNIIFGV